MKIVSKYTGTCYKCDQPINKGDLIDWISDQNPSHWSCPVQETPYDNTVATCRQRAYEAELPEVTQGGNRPMIVQCLCGHTERYDLFPRYRNEADPQIPQWRDDYLIDSDPSDDAILANRASRKCSKCQKEQKHKTARQLKAAKKAREKRRANCAHSWEWLSHEERKCVKCGEIEFIPDMD